MTGHRRTWPLAIGLAIALLTAACGADGSGAADEDGVPVGATRPLPLTDPSETPPVDTSVAEVPLDEVVFDTFDGGSVGLDAADRATIERLFDAIPPLDAPGYERVDSAEGWLVDDDVVVGYEDADGEAWAFPTRILDRHEIVNEELADQPLLVSWCPLCESGVVYDRRVGGTERSFSNTSALHDNDLVMVDRETGTYWWQVAGRAIVGPDAGATLTPLPSITTTWRRWQAAHPGTAVLARPDGRDYGPSQFTGYADRVDAGDTPFPVGGDALDDGRVPASSVVIAVESTDGVIAWPVSPARALTDEVAGRAVELEVDGTGGTVTDRESGEPLPVRTSMWFAVVAAFPDVELRSG